MNRMQLAAVGALFLAVSAGAGQPGVALLDFWQRLSGVDTLTLLSSSRAVGVLISSIRVDTAAQKITYATQLRAVNWMAPAGGDSIVIREQQAFRPDGHLLSAYQELISAAGANSWQLKNSDTGWVVLQRSGGVLRSSKLATPPHDNLRARTSLYGRVLDSTIASGQSWIDTVFDLTAQNSMVLTTICRSAGDSAGQWRCELVTRNSQTTLEERVVLNRAGKVMYQQVAPLFEAVRGGGHEPYNAALMTENSPFAVKARGQKSARSVLVLELDSAVALPAEIARLYTPLTQGLAVAARQGRCSDRSGAADSLEHYLVPTATMQSDDPRIINLAATLGARKKNPCAYVTDVTEHVFKLLEKRNTATYSSAIETLAAGFGDCGEHAVLVAALLRAGGIPARVVMGLVGIGDNTFGYHAWVQVFTGEWLYADPAFGHFPARNELVPLAFDDQGRSATLLAGMIGRIRLSFIQPSRQ